MQTLSNEKYPYSPYRSALIGFHKVKKSVGVPAGKKLFTILGVSNNF
jgi:hypothetical protein